MAPDVENHVPSGAGTWCKNHEFGTLSEFTCAHVEQTKTVHKQCLVNSNLPKQNSTPKNQTELSRIN